MASAGADFLAGCVGGATGLIAAHPLDVIRIRLQTSPSSYRGFWHCLALTARYDGIRGLFSGVVPPLTGVAFQNAILFGTYGPICRYLDPDHATKDVSVRNVMIAGTVAGSAQTVIATPIELLKIRLQARGSPYRDTLHCAQMMVRQYGFAGLYRGFAVTFWRDMPSYGCYFGSYEACNRWLSRRFGLPSTVCDLLAGGVAGIAGWVPVYPVDVIKSRLQADRRGTYHGIVHCFSRSMRTEGFRWMFNGIGTTIARAFVVNALTFAAYEAMVNVLTAT